MRGLSEPPAARANALRRGAGEGTCFAAEVPFLSDPSDGNYDEEEEQEEETGVPGLASGADANSWGRSAKQEEARFSVRQDEARAQVVEAARVPGRMSVGGDAPLTVAVALFSSTLRTVVARFLTESGCFARVVEVAPPPRPPLTSALAEPGGESSVVGPTEAAAFAASLDDVSPPDHPLAVLIDAGVLGPLARAVRFSPSFRQPPACVGTENVKQLV